MARTSNLTSSFPTKAYCQTHKSGHATGHDLSRRPDTQLNAIAHHMVRLERDWNDAKAKRQTDRAARIETLFIRAQGQYIYFLSIVEHKAQQAG